MGIFIAFLAPFWEFGKYLFYTILRSQLFEHSLEIVILLRQFPLSYPVYVAILLEEAFKMWCYIEEANTEEANTEEASTEEANTAFKMWCYIEEANIEEANTEEANIEEVDIFL